MKMLRFAHEQGKLPTEPPRVKLFDERENERQYVPDYDEEAALIEAVRNHAKVDAVASEKGGRPRKVDGDVYADLFIVLVETGMRLSEGIKLPWSRIEDGRIKLWDKQTIKNKLPRAVPLSKLAQEALERRAGTKGGPFHGCKKNRAQQLFARAREQVGITDKDCVIHSFRHAAATRMLEETDNILLTMEYLGHLDMRTTKKYAKVGSKALAAGVEKLEARRAAAKKGGDAEKLHSGTGNLANMESNPIWQQHNSLPSFTFSFGMPGKGGVDEGTRTPDNRNHNPVL